LQPDFVFKKLFFFTNSEIAVTKLAQLQN